MVHFFGGDGVTTIHWIRRSTYIGQEEVYPKGLLRQSSNLGDSVVKIVKVVTCAAQYAQPASLGHSRHQLRAGRAALVAGAHASQDDRVFDAQ